MRKRKLISEVKGKKGQQLNQREVKLINSGVVEGFLRLDVKSNRHSVKLIFNTDGLVGLQEFTQMNEMTKRLFVILLRNIVVALKSVEKNKLSSALVNFDPYSSYVDPSSWHVYLMYVPLQPYELDGDLKTYLQRFISLCNFSAVDDVTYVQELVAELKDNIAYTAGKLDDYCNRISEELTQGQANLHGEMSCPICKAKLTEDESICPFCGAKVPVLHINKAESKSRAISVEPTSECGIEFSAQQLQDSSNSISINEDENGVVTVFRGTRRIVQSIWLEDCQQAGRIFITKFPFRIGKMEGATDYRIYNNRVSRKHADVVKEQGKYFIIDLGSTNGTFLNGRRLQPGVKQELSDEAILVLADSKFKVHID